MKSLEGFQTQIYKEWVEQSGIDPELYNLNVECVSDEVQSYGGDVSRPLHDALGWTTSRWSLKGKERNHGAIIRSHDGSVFQVKLQNPVTDKVRNKLRKYETPLGSKTKPFFATINLKIWLSLENVSSDTVVAFLYKYINQKITTEKGDYRDLTPAQISEAFWQWVKESKQTIIWCEGAKKALCLLSHGYIAIALSGVANGYRTPKDALGNKIGKSYLIPEVADFIQGQEQHICFDSDTNPKTVKGVNANIKAFGGLINAKAKEVTKSKVDTDIVLVLSWNSELGKGVDDLIVVHGVETFKLVDESAKTYTNWKHEQEQKLNLQVSLAVCRQYLGEVKLPDDAKAIVIKSAMNTGKTFTISDLIKDKIGDPNQVIFVITHRDNLASELSNRFCIVHRKEIRTSAEGSLFGYVLCADSLHSKADPSFNPNDYEGKTITVILDECESVAWHVLNSQTDINKHRPEVLDNISKLISMALSGNGQLFLADAHASDRSYNFFMGLACQHKPELAEIEPFVIVNSFKFNEKPWNVHPFKSKSPSYFFKCLDEYLTQKSDAKALLQIESQKEYSKWSTQTVERDLKKKFPDKKIVRVDSLTVQNPDHPAYGATKNFNEFCKQWDIVICSNVIESGVSIDIKGHFDSVWANIWGVSSTRQANQMLARLREPVDRYVWISERAMGRIGNGSDNAYALLKSTDKTTKATIQALQQHGLGDFDTESGCLNFALQFWANYGAEINHQGKTLYESVIANIAADGHKIMDCETEHDPDTSKAMEAVMNENYDLIIDQTENAENINEQTAKQYEQTKTGLIDKQRYELRKHSLIKRYGAIAPNTVRDDNNGWYGQLRLHYLLTVGKDFLYSQDINRVNDLNGRGFAPDVAKKTYWAKVKLLNEINIVSLLPADGEQVILHDGCDRLQPVFEKIAHWRYEIKNIFGITLPAYWFEKPKDHDGKSREWKPSPIKAAKRMLKLLGAKLMNNGRAGVRGKQVTQWLIVRDFQTDDQGLTCNVVQWGEDNRDQVFSFWFFRDYESQNVSTSDTVVDFLYKGIEKNGYETSEKGTTDTAIATTSAPNPSPKTRNKPPKNDCDGETMRDRIAKYAAHDFW